jgi:glutamine amidotransferase
LIAIIDYGVGNLRSLEKAFSATGQTAVVSCDRGLLADAGALVLPGVGAFRACMKAFSANKLDELVLRRVNEGVPLLGVCVGMQMLFQQSEEFGLTPGLSLLPGYVKRFTDDLTVPHVGWNQVEHHGSHSLLQGIENRSFFYFVHSFYCIAADQKVVVGETEYGNRYASVVVWRNIHGVQFHPEKSQAVGLRLLQNFADLATSESSTATRAH